MPGDVLAKISTVACTSVGCRSAPVADRQRVPRCNFVGVGYIDMILWQASRQNHDSRIELILRFFELPCFHQRSSQNKSHVALGVALFARTSNTLKSLASQLLGS